MNLTLRNEEPDRVPVSDTFWSSFVTRWREELGLPGDADPYVYYDLDWIPTVPNLDPHIGPFEVLRETEAEIVVRTGFGATIRKKRDYPMPSYVGFATDTLEKMATFDFDDPWDERRYFRRGDSQIAGVGDVFLRDLPPWVDTVESLYPRIPVYGSVCEGHEMLWRIIGSENVMLWIGLYPDAVGRFVERINAFNLELTRAQIRAADGLLAGMVIWGDVAYRKDMFFAPDYWRRYFMPGVQAIVAECHGRDLPVIYHGCGNARRIFDDLIAAGIDAYNPLEAKAGLDVLDLRCEYGHDIFAFCGNMDVQEWAHSRPVDLEPIVMRKLNAAKGGGYVFQSDHSVPSNISGANYDFVVNLVRDRARYPLDLGEFDIPYIH
jgi:hypothetical protein